MTSISGGFQRASESRPEQPWCDLIADHALIGSLGLKPLEVPSSLSYCVMIGFSGPKCNQYLRIPARCGG